MVFKVHNIDGKCHKRKLNRVLISYYEFISSTLEQLF